MSKTEIVYISGPMTGIAEYNFPLFNRVAAQFRADGYSVLNPAEWAEHADWIGINYLSRDVAMMLAQNKRGQQ